VSQGPFKTVGDVYSIPNLSSKEKEVLKTNEGRFVALEVKPEYDIDKINNGLYR
jgi:photosystem II PsbU protein